MAAMWFGLHRVAEAKAAGGKGGAEQQWIMLERDESPCPGEKISRDRYGAEASQLGKNGVALVVKDALDHVRKTRPKENRIASGCSKHLQKSRYFRKNFIINLR